MKRCVGHLKLTFQALRFSQLRVCVGPSSPKCSQAKHGETRKPNTHFKGCLIHHLKKKTHFLKNITYIFIYFFIYIYFYTYFQITKHIYLKIYTKHPFTLLFFLSSLTLLSILLLFVPSFHPTIISYILLRFIWLYVWCFNSKWDALIQNEMTSEKTCLYLYFFLCFIWSHAVPLFKMRRQLTSEKTYLYLHFSSFYRWSHEAK